MPDAKGRPRPPPGSWRKKVDRYEGPQPLDRTKSRYQFLALVLLLVAPYQLLDPPWTWYAYGALIVAVAAFILWRRRRASN